MRAVRVSGFSIVEVLTVLSALAALGAGLTWARQIGDAGFAARFARDLVAVRSAAASAGHAIAVTGGPCPGAVRLAGPGPALEAVRGGLSRGLVFTPDGFPRTCDGGGVGNTTILLEHRGRRSAVIVSSLGRVRWEMR